MRVSSKIYYGYTGRLKDNRGKSSKNKTSVIKDPVPAKKFCECSCTRMIQIIDNVFITHADAFGVLCDGSGEHKDYWKY